MDRTNNLLICIERVPRRHLSIQVRMCQQLNINILFGFSWQQDSNDIDYPPEAFK